MFNITELNDAIAVSKDTATGPDDIHYQMLKHHPETALDTLLHEKSCRTNKLQTNSANKLPLQNTRENDKQTTCLVLRI